MSLSARNTYLLAPNFDFPPGGAIVLGNLIADPFAPHRAVATLAPEYRPTITRTIQTDRVIVRGTARSISLSQGAQLMQLVGTKLGFERADNATAEYHMSALRTEYFNHDPSDNPLKALLTTPRAKAAMRGSLWTRPLFLVSGIKIAEGFVYRRSGDAVLGVSASANVTVPAGVDVGLGSEVGVDRATRNEDSFSAAGEVILAYQLLRVARKGWREARIALGEYRTKHGFLSADNKQKATTGDGLDIAIAEMDDIAAALEDEEFDMDELHIQTGDGNAIHVVIPQAP